jgi:peptide/nickel transport system substrate-binding protein
MAVLLGGCGSGDEEQVSDGAGGAPGGGGELVWALPEGPGTLDPLFARTPTERLVARQMYEPLVERLAGPFDDPRRVPGIARVVRPTGDPTVWKVELRPGVRFGDGAPVNAAAVLANAERWQALPELSGLPPQPQLFVFAPKPPYEVRFKLAEPDPGFGRKLASPALGLVSPPALRRGPDEEVGFGPIADSGGGPFELRERGAGALVLARNAEWWGTERALGPGLDLLEFSVEPSAGERAMALRDGVAQVASELNGPTLRVLGMDPLLTVVSDDEGIVAERSIRGIPPDDAVPSLNGVWRTRIAAG